MMRSKITDRYTVTITEVIYDENKEEDNLFTRYSQTVDQLDMQAVINAVNSTPQHQQQPQRKRALRSDAGKPRKYPDAITQTVDGDVV